MIYKYLLFATYLSICKATNYDAVTYVYTINQGSFNIEGQSECFLDTNTPFSTIQTDSIEAECNEGVTASCIFNNPVECTDVARACKGNLVGGKCGTQDVDIKDCCYGIIDTAGTGTLATEGSCPFSCIGLPGFGTTYHGCKTCSCSYGYSVSSSDC